MKKLLLLIVAFCFGVSTLFAQTKQISGKVTAADDGSPIPGASVVVKGTTNGTTTNVDGEFSMLVPENETLVFSFVGMKTVELPVTNSAVYNVAMEVESIGVDEVVVTAVGIKRNARSLTYAVQQVAGDDVEHKVETDVIRALSGRIAGVNITASGGAAGAATNITIRGNSSALGNNQPLFVVDGIPFDNSQTNTQNPNVHGSTYSNRALDIDPNDIESISVLKGGSAAALYGTRAANGVIIITTKSGGKGDKNFNVSFTSSFALEEPAKMPSYQNEYGQGANQQFNPGYMGTWGPRFDAPYLDGNGDTAATLFMHDGVISYVNHLGETVPYKAFPNNVSDFFETGTVFENSLSISGGDENTNFITSITANNHDGFIPFTGLDKYSLKVAGNKKIGNKLTVGASLTYVNILQEGVPTGGFGVTNTSIFGQLWIMPRSYNLSGFPYIDPLTQENIHYRSDLDNPYYLAQENGYTSTLNRVYGYGSLNYEFTSELNMNFKFGFNNYTDRRQQVYAKSTQYNGGNGAIFEDVISNSQIESTLLLTYNKQLSGAFNLTAIGGWNLSENKYTNLSMEGNDIIVHGIDRLENTKTIIPGLYNSESKTRLVGVFADITLGYNNWVFLNLTGRNDWSSTLPIKENSFFYPSATASFVLTDALKLNSDILSYLKVYGGLSRIGSDAFAYLTRSTYDVNPNYGNNLGNLEFPFKGTAALAMSDSRGNAEIKPEITKDWEVGTDIQLFNSRLAFDFTYYNRSTEDQIFFVTVPASTGFIQQAANAGEISNKGVEASVKIRPIYKPTGLKWEMLYNFSRNRSEIVELFEGVEKISVGTNYVGFDIVHKVGEPFGMLEFAKLRRDDEGNLLINPETGYATEETNVSVASDPNPDYIMSLDNHFSYKGFRASFLFSYRKGGDIYSNTVSSLRERGVAEETAVNREAGHIIKGVYADPDNPDIPWIVDGEKVENKTVITTNDYYFRGFPGFENGVFDASVFRLREATIGYSFPKTMFTKLPIESLNLTLIGRNLWMYAPNIPHIDPELNAYGADNRQGVDFYYMPNARRYALSLKVTF